MMYKRPFVLATLGLVALTGACMTPERTTARRERNPGDATAPAPGTVQGDRNAERRDRVEDLCRLSGGVYNTSARPPNEGIPIPRPAVGGPSDYRCERERG